MDMMPLYSFSFVRHLSEECSFLIHGTDVNLTVSYFVENVAINNWLL